MNHLQLGPGNSIPMKLVLCNSQLNQNQRKEKCKTRFVRAHSNFEFAISPNACFVSDCSFLLKGRRNVAPFFTDAGKNQVYIVFAWMSAIECFRLLNFFGIVVVFGSNNAKSYLRIIFIYRVLCECYISGSVMFNVKWLCVTNYRWKRIQIQTHRHKHAHTYASRQKKKIKKSENNKWNEWVSNKKKIQ